MAALQLNKEKILTFVVLFFFYSTLGAILEHLFYFFGKHKKKMLFNPILTGFPLYGLGAYLVVAVHEAIGKTWNIAIQFCVYAALLALLEYTAGRIIGAGTNGRHPDGTVRTWDYSNDRFNYRGIIKVQNIILFGIMALIVVRVHPFLKDRVSRMFKEDDSLSESSESLSDENVKFKVRDLMSRVFHS